MAVVDGADAAGGRVVEDRRYGIYDARRYRSEAENDAAEAAASKGGKVSAASKRKAPTSSSAAAPKKSAKQTVKVEDTEIWYEQPNVAKAGAVKYRRNMKNNDHATERLALFTEGVVK